jgi:hypothetical protein
MAQLYPTIVNPYMPNGTPNLTNSPSPAYAPGEIGSAFTDQNVGGKYLRVYLDSGATSATTVGAPVAGQLAYWKNQGLSIVTNDKNQCDLGPTAAPNRIAGVFQLAPTTAPGVNDSTGAPVQYYTDLILQKGNASLAASGSVGPGQYATGNTAANTANCVGTAVGTAPPSQTVGVWTTATVTNGIGTADINIGFVD